MTTPIAPTPAPLPLFYKAPVLLRSQDHRAFGVRAGTNFRFAAGAASIPLTLGEFAPAGRTYPIVFSNDAAARPMVVTGLDAGGNLFVTAEGEWTAGAYIPAYVRRYPFISFEGEGDSQLMLGVDGASDQISADAARDGADPFFDAEGQPTERARAAMGFCQTYAQEDARSRAFSAALLAHDLLVEKSAELVFADTGKAVVTGFRIIEEAAFRALPAAKVTEFHANGWLDLMVMQLASQLGWQGLVDTAVRLRAKAA
ncbi:MAG: hypothetical protein B7Z15_04925 [Rhizobiales bacterium 32-66-8]|nr:MAG: hypothetical protein B7Z15_04925 [Rhizobiales bacterium 32-66-8]